MKILFDYQAFYLQKFGGISNAFTQLLKNMPADVECELSLVESDNVHLRDSGVKSVPPMTGILDDFIVRRNFKGKKQIYNLYSKIFPSQTALGRNRLCSINALKRGDFDIFHPTFFDGYFLPFLNGKPFVLHVYDMISEKFFKANDMQTVEKRRQVALAAHIIAISEKTKEDIIELLHVPEDKVSVAYLAATDILLDINSESLIDGKYILFVGNRDSYKNFMPMMRELMPVLIRHPDLKIVCTGPLFTQNEITFFKKNKLEDRLIHFRPSDIELRNLYYHAVCFVFPSLYEGFGIPILEAWQAQCPTLLNNKSCFPEIAQDAGVYFNLDENGSDLENVMEDFLSMSNEGRREIIEKQNKRLTDFSWKKSADKLVEIYRNILQKEI